MTDQGGSAFPWENNYGYERGLTKREWFAGMALIGLLNSDYMPKNDTEIISSDCYRYADAMLKESQTRRED